TPATWRVVGSLPQLSSGGTLLKEVGGRPVVFLSLERTFYAYAAECPACKASLDGAALDGDELRCPGCSLRYDARHAGASLDSAGVQLEPIPLLQSDSGIVKIALRSV